MPQPFVTGLRKAEVEFIELMQDDFDLEQYRAPYWVYQNKPNCQCPACGIDMMIAGWYDKPEKTTQGDTIKSQHECYSCGKFVIPKQKGSNDSL